MSNLITIPKDVKFELPEGRYRASICGYRTQKNYTDNGLEEKAIILFDVQVPGLENFDCRARKLLDLDLSSGSDMRYFLSGLLGREFFSSRSNQSVDLERELVGKPCEISLFHKRTPSTKKHKFPFVDVDYMRPVTVGLQLERGGL